MGWYRPVHAKSADAEEVRALLVGRSNCAIPRASLRSVFTGMLQQRLWLARHLRLSHDLAR